MRHRNGRVKGHGARTWRRLYLLGISLLAVWSLTATTAADTGPSYRIPPQPLADIVDAPPTPEVRLSPDREWMLLLERPNLISLAELAQPELRIGGRRIRARTNGPSRKRP